MHIFQMRRQMAETGHRPGKQEKHLTSDAVDGLVYPVPGKSMLSMRVTEKML